MDLKQFVKKTVKPGEPLTAQGWNDVLDGVDQLYQFIAATRHTLRVTITNAEIDPERVRVSASRAAGAPVEAVRPIPPSKQHTLSGLEAGAWTVTAELAGYQTATAAANIADPGESSIEMALAKVGNFMPDLFGATLADARKALADAGVPLVRVLDFTGRDLPPTQPDPHSDSAPVLVHGCGDARAHLAYRAGGAQGARGDWPGARQGNDRADPATTLIRRRCGNATVFRTQSASQRREPPHAACR